MPKKIFIASAVVLAALVVGWYILFGPTPVPPSPIPMLIGETAVIRRATVDGQPMPNAYIALSFLDDNDTYGYLNVAVDLNQDGLIAPYAADGQTQEEWVVKNFHPRIRREAGNSFGFDLPDLGVDKRTGFKVAVMLNEQAVAGWDGNPHQDTSSRTLTVAAIERDEIRPRFKPDPKGIRTGALGDLLAPNAAYAMAGGVPDRPPEYAGKEQGKTGKPEDLILIGGPSVKPLDAPLAAAPGGERGGFDVYHAGVPDITQGPNECVPTAVANSLIWLAKENGFEDRLPTDPAELVKELKVDFNQTADGVNVPKDFLNGKWFVTERRNLPVETHQVGGLFDRDIVKKIAAELQKGQDVEIDMEYGYYDASGTYRRVGGHMVTVVGAFSLGTDTYLDIHDPASPGPGTLDIYRVDGTRVVNYRYQGRAVTYIRYAIAESPAPAPKTQAALTATSTEGGTGEGGVALTGGPFKFSHKIGATRCPTAIGVLHVAVAMANLQWSVLGVPSWLNVSKTSGKGPADVNLSFNCRLSKYVTQDLSAELTVQAMDAAKKPVGLPQTVKVGGSIKQ